MDQIFLQTALQDWWGKTKKLKYADVEIVKQDTRILPINIKKDYNLVITFQIKIKMYFVIDLLGQSKHVMMLIYLLLNSKGKMLFTFISCEISSFWSQGILKGVLMSCEYDEKWLRKVS